MQFTQIDYGALVLEFPHFYKTANTEVVTDYGVLHTAINDTGTELLLNVAGIAPVFINNGTGSQGHFEINLNGAGDPAAFAALLNDKLLPTEEG